VSFSKEQDFRDGMELADLSSEAVVVFNPDGAILYWNPSASALYGHSSDSAIGQNLFGLVSCSTQLLGDELTKALDVNSSWSGVVQRKTAARADIDVSIRWTVRRGEDGSAKFIVEYASALESADALAQLRVREERYDTIFERMPVALILADSQGIGRIVRELRASGHTDIDAFLDTDTDYLNHAKNIISLAHANQEAVRLLGAKTEGEIVGPVGYIWADSPATFKRAIISRYNGDKQFTEETKLRTFDGRTIDAVFTIAFPPVDDRMGRSLLCIVDITNLRSAEAQLKKIQTDFAHAARVSMLGELMAALAHELNQPLAAIALNAAAAQRWLSRPEPADDKAKTRISRIASDATRASEMIRRIRGVATKHNPAYVDLDLNAIVGAALLFVGHDLDSKSIKVVSNLGCSLPGFVGDRVLMQQVVVNILQNSLHAIESSPHADQTIELATFQGSSGELILSIRDGGAGVSQEDLPFVFEGFYTTKEEGLGMGLTICQSIVEAHGGEIRFADGTSEGATVLVSIPAKGDTLGPFSPPGVSR
jgi:two-component system sensor kinase FixL